MDYSVPIRSYQNGMFRSSAILLRMEPDAPAPPAPDQPDQPDRTGQPPQADATPEPAAPLSGLSGRRAEAARNDERIIEAARAVFLADPNAPISAVAERAGVGIAALYRRYTGKEDLIKRLYMENQDSLQAEIDAALAADGDPWEIFCRFIHRSLDVGAGSLSLRFPGAFDFTGDVLDRAILFDNGIRRLTARAHAAGAMRPDVGDGDIQWIFVSAQAIQVTDERRSGELRHRYLALLLDGLHAGAASPLPGPPPTGEEYEEYWHQRLATGERS